MLEELFNVVLNASPNTWQTRLYERLVAGEIPKGLRVPTSGGKTAILLIFLAALASQSDRGNVTLPRRLVMAVNRRALVDQASGLAHAINQALDNPRLAVFRAHLAALSASGSPLALTTLRGQLADSREWSHDPTTPAIILATPDMLGSRLLFQGYGLGRSRKSMEAGLLGIDTLVVLDEAHLSPTFTELMREIETLAATSAASVGRPALRVLEMSATTAETDVFDGRPNLIQPDPRDLSLIKRLNASKALILESPPLPAALDTSNKKAEVKIIEALIQPLAAAAFKHQAENVPIAIFVNGPETAAKLASALTKLGIPSQHIMAMTGPQRTFEREQLIASEDFQVFMRGENYQDGSRYFICTSAGEIGMDIDAHYAFADQVTLDRQIQRIGRVNRRGERQGSRITLFTWPSQEPTIQATQKMLESLPNSGDLFSPERNASPVALSALIDNRDGYLAAIKANPPRRPLEPALLDLWSMTSLQYNAQSQPALLHIPQADSLIHALNDSEEADIELAWREPPQNLDISAWLALLPIQRQELARLPQWQAMQFLQVIGKRSPNLQVIVQTPNSSYRQALPILKLQPGVRIILPPEAGGLTPQGLPSANELPNDRLDLNVPLLLHWSDEQQGWHSETPEPMTADTLEALQQQLEQQLGCLLLIDKPLELIDSDGNPCVTRLLAWPLQEPDRVPEDNDQSSISVQRLLDEHHALAAAAARRIVGKLALPEPLAQAIIDADAKHDQGKAEARWQLAFHNQDPDNPIAKTAGKRPPDLSRLDGYRHELGSVASMPSATPLTLHLIAAHHGWARPVFPDKAAAKLLPTLGGDCRQAAQQSALRYAALQQQYGWWGLAYLEAIVKCADILAETLADELKGECHAV